MVLNVLEVRMAIEIESAALAAQRRSPSQEADIRAAFHAFDVQLQRGEPTGASDFAFHRAIAQATNNPFYVEMLDVLGRRAIPCDVTSPWRIEPVPTREYQQAVQAEHWLIVAAISEQDVEAARAAMRRHLVRSQELYRQRLREAGPTSDTRQ
jgi:DNA-binding FadR family transcriptional regulator